jgi:hypothetical protein
MDGKKHANTYTRPEVRNVATCEQIRRSITVDVPPTVADQEWTQFIFYTLYLAPPSPDAREAEPEEGFVRLSSSGDGRTTVAVDLNYCAQWKDVEDEKEIAAAQTHLDWVLGRYKEFVERRAA